MDKPLRQSINPPLGGQGGLPSEGRGANPRGAGGLNLGAGGLTSGYRGACYFI